MSVESGGKVTSNTFPVYIGHESNAIGIASISGASSILANVGYLNVGQSGKGELRIFSAGQVSSGVAYLGLNAGADGSAVISGTGSTWTSDYLSVGSSGNGRLRIERGGRVTASQSTMGVGWGANGTAVVSGSESLWRTGHFVVGQSGTAVLTVGDHGTVLSETVTISSRSAVNLIVSGNDMLVLGYGMTAGITNNGSVNICADMAMTPGSYRPISRYSGGAVLWSGSGSYNAFGGVWDNVEHTFTVAAAIEAGTGENVSIASGQRVLFTDSATGKHVGVSVGQLAAVQSISVSPIAAGDLDNLLALESPGRSVLAGWDFDTSLSGGDVLVSIEIGEGVDVGLGGESLRLWHLDGSAWTLVSAELFIDETDGLVSFMASEFSGYALTVPEPGMLAVAAFGALGLMRTRRRIR